MSRFLRLGAFLSVLFFATNVFAAGYSCPTYKKYTSCNAGYYLNGTGVGNACSVCTSGCTCAGGTAAPVCNISVSCSGGKYIAKGATTCTTTCEAGYKCPVGTYTISGSGASAITGRTACSGTAEYQDSTGQSTCKSVSDGYYKNGNTAQQVCGTGYYCKSGVRSACTSYRANTTTTTTTASASSSCVCTAGRYLNSTTCTVCATGTYKGSAGNGACTSASSGYYVSSTGATSQSACTSWRANTNTNGATGSTSTSACVCKAGTYLNGSTCTSCSAGTYKSANSNATSCTTASSGYYVSSTGATSQSACTSWRANTNTNGATGSTSTSACVCKAGTYLNGSTCSSCSAGTYKSANSNATSCTACSGRTKYSAAGASSCSTVSTGYYTTGCNSSSNACTGQSQCSAGTYCSSGISYSCPAGTYGSTAGLSSSSCSGSCTAGYYCPAGSTSATQNACTAGNYCPAGSGSQTACSSLGGGLYVNSAAKSDAAADCYVTVSAGKYLSSASSTSLSTCTAGYYCAGTTLYYNSTGGRTACGAGKYSASGSDASSDCANITAGCYGTSASSACPAVCADNEYSNAGASSCTSCPTDYENTGTTAASHAGSASCIITVDGGKYIGTAGDNSSNWDTCACGTYKASHTVAYGSTSSCTTTSAGYYAAAGASSQTKATAGYYAAAGACSQTACSGRTKYSAAGASSCSTVSTGYYTTGCNSSSNACTGQSQCSAGTYCSSGISYSCPAGTYGSTAGLSSSSCSGSCTAGYYCPAGSTSATQNACSTLASGFYPNSAAGSDAATDCYTDSISGKYVASANATSATTCANWTYKGAHTVNYGSTSSCTSCLTVPDAVSGVEWTKATGTGWTSYSSCVVSQTPANCASGSVKRTQSSASAWGGTTLASTLKSNAGYYASTSATACTICPAGSYCPASATSATACATGSYTSATGKSACTACSAGKTTSGTGKTSCDATCSNATGVSAWETPSWSDNTVSNLCTVAASAGCSANYYKSSNSCLTCSSGTNGKYTLSAAGTTSVNSCYLKTTAGKYVATKSAGETACVSPYYCEGGTTIYYGTGTTTGGTSTCTGLGAIYTKSDAGASLDTQCYATTTVAKWVASAKATAESACTAGYYCAGGTKVYYNSTGGRAQCTAGNYCPASSSAMSACSTLDGGLYVNSAAGSDADTDCYFTTTGGKYITASTDTAQTTCPAKSYCPATKLYYPNAGGINDCPDPTSSTYKESVADMDWLTTACPDATTSNSSVSSVAWQSWSNTGLSAITQCKAVYYVQTPCARFTFESTLYNSTDGTYDTDKGSRYANTVNAGYYFTTRYSSTYCDTTSTTSRMLYKNALKCPANSYCPGGTVPLCTSGEEYADTWGLYACTSLGDFYTTSNAGAKVNTECYGTTSAGNFVETANSGETTCTCGGYCPGSVTVNYGSTGGKTNCAAGTYNTSTGSSTSSVCKTTSAGYYAAAGACSQTQVNANCWGTAGSKVACPNSCTSPYSLSAKGSDDANDCYLTTTAKNYVATAGAGQTTCVAGGYCAGGSTIYKGGSVSGRATTGGMSVCGTSTYSDAGASSCSACATDNGYTNSGTSASNHAGVASCKATCGAGEYVATAGAGCVDVSAGYWGAGGTVAQNATLSRTACDTGLTTIGYGTGANEVADCGRKLHAGDNVIYLRSEARTSPALNVKVDDTTFYGALSTSLSGALKVKSGSTEYSVVNDYQ